MNEVTKHEASKFLESQCGRFARSKVSLYCALILDVAHNVPRGSDAGAMPAGYPLVVAGLLDENEQLAAKYCTVIGRALQSKHASEIIESFAPTAQGVDLFGKWLTQRTKDAGYTLSLEDIKYFFKGEASTKARLEAKKQADAQQAEITRMAEEARSQQGAAQSKAHDAADAASKAEMRETNEALVAEIPLSPKQEQQEVEHGTVVIGQTGDTQIITVTEHGTGYVVNVPDNLADEAIEAVMAYLQGMQAARAAVAEIQALETASA